jgi:hypothetical protein
VAGRGRFWVVHVVDRDERFEGAVVPPEGGVYVGRHESRGDAFRAAAVRLDVPPGMTLRIFELPGSGGSAR